MELIVQFSDSTDTTIISYFTSPQDPDVWSNLGAVDVSDARWKMYYDAQPVFMQAFLPTPQSK